MKRPALVTFMILAFITISMSVSAEYIFKKDGAIIKGRIVRDAAKSVTILKDDKKREVVRRSNIMRILYTKLYLGKVFVRMTTGKVLEVYMVDEDQESYTFRKKLYSPKEFKVPRSKVMFIARTNPTDLAGKADTTSVALTWSPPFKPAKEYRVYMKEPTAPFKVIGKTSSEKYEISNLKSNTKYSFRVTAIDGTGAESMPTDVVKVTTKNIMPDAPKGLMSKEVVKNGKKALMFTWKGALDPDGTVKQYQVFRDTGMGYTLVSKTTGTSLQINDGDNVKYLAVKSVDDRGGISEISTLSVALRLSLRVKPVFMMPFGPMTDLVSYGYGALGMITLDNLFFKGSSLGFESGYIMFESNSEYVKSMFFVPMSLMFGYRYRFTESLTLVPQLYAGFVYLQTTYSSRGELGIDALTEQTITGIDPMGRAHLTLAWQVSADWSIELGAGYGLIYEMENLFHHLVVTAGVGYNL